MNIPYAHRLPKRSRLRPLMLTLVLIACQLSLTLSHKRSSTFESAQAQERPASKRGSLKIARRLAVLMLVNRARLTAEEVEYLTDLTRRASSQQLRDRISVITRENIEVMLPEGRTLEDCEAECEVKFGRELGVDYTVNGSVIRFGKHLRVTLKLHEMQSGELLGTEVAGAQNLLTLEQELQASAQRLVRRLTSDTQKPDGVTQRRIITNTTTEKTLFTAGAPVIVTLRSQPLGASISIDDVLRCSEGTDLCKVELKEGSHEVVMSLKDHFSKRAAVTFGAAGVREVNWVLEPNFVTLEVRPVPETLRYLIDDEAHTGPVTMRVKPQARHRVISDDPCYIAYGEEVIGAAGDHLLVEMQPRAQQSGIEVSALDANKSPISALIKVDTGPTGTTPTQLIVNTCSRTLTVSHDGFESQTIPLELSAGGVTHISAQLTPSSELRSNTVDDSTETGVDQDNEIISWLSDSRIIVWFNVQGGVNIPDVNSAQASAYGGAQIGGEIHGFGESERWFFLGKMYGVKMFPTPQSWGALIEVSYPIIPFNLGVGRCFGVHCLSLSVDFGSVLFDGTSDLIFGEDTIESLNDSDSEETIFNPLIKTDDPKARGRLGLFPVSLRYTVPISGLNKGEGRSGVWRFMSELSVIPVNYNYKWFPTPSPGLYPVRSTSIPILLGVGVEYAFDL